VHQLIAARAGVGIAISPCYLADPIPELRRISSPVDELQGELWIVTHKALKETARIRTCLAIIGDGAEAAAKGAGAARGGRRPGGRLGPDRRSWQLK
jgi:DNA-binding transcriptional LysR family regulator